MSASLLIALGTILLLVTFVVRPVARSLAENKAKYSVALGHFLDAAPTLVADDRIGEASAEILLLVASKVDEPGFVFPLIATILQNNNKRPAKTAYQRKFVAEVDALPSELKGAFSETLAYGFIAISYSSFLWGWLLRSIWLRPVGMPERSTDAPYFAARMFAHCH